MTEASTLVCTICHKSFPLDTQEWRCTCGGLFDFETWPELDGGRIDASQPGLWRYRNLLPVDPNWAAVTLGEGNTPLIPAEWEGQRLFFKLEFLAPTGSFKDRGTAVLVTALRGLGIQRVVEDSSGNAGASLAAYTACAGISCGICIPISAAGPKVAQMSACGADVIQVKGKRAYAALAAWAAAAHGAYYASHVYNPYFLAGTETLVYELWEQLGRRAPAAVVLPVCNGTLMLGVYRGFQRLHRAGLIPTLPRLFGVQAANCAPIYEAFLDGRDSVQPVTPVSTTAASIAISQPALGTQVLEAVRATQGAVVTVTEEELKKTHSQLARRGLYVEETSALPVAALAGLGEQLCASAEEAVVVPLTGHGLKTWREG
jgi:threonine synthase